ncbi:MAG: hypothetical protein C4542_08240 [Dehalococcoidia bacterium]|nr:MAG: hypothetical protein C4542_08240 [Dehalococcoidia bacterium]
MPREKKSIHVEPDLNMELKRLNFVDFLEKLYGRKWGSRRKFAEERKLDLSKVYRQLNGIEKITPDMLKEMAAFVKANS